ncbi:MAG TPA: NADH-quinone oxidoreductase subunit J [Chloroflexi bacterium]|nr:MAG: NADH-quinone oxidoreductase subunit J [Chloroflexota bacterium]HDD55953.1 NADH-quinone oxidoreductase subunit J [Chloroflexota bacterium]
MLVSVLVFVFASLVTLGAAVAVVTNKNILHSAFYLILAFVGVAAIYVMLEAPFIAMVQVLVYIGAIAILIVFAIMLTRRLMSKDMDQKNAQWIPSALGSLTLFVVLGWIVYTAGWPAQEGAMPAEPISQLGQDLLTTYLVPFEIASVLLLAALVGAILIGRERETRSAE